MRSIVHKNAIPEYFCAILLTTANKLHASSLEQKIKKKTISRIFSFLPEKNTFRRFFLAKLICDFFYKD